MRRAVHPSSLSTALLVCIYVAVPLFGQSDAGTIVGFVRDQSGAVVADAQITLRDEGTDEAHSATTDAHGRYTIPNLRPVDYTMTAEANGFGKFVSTHNKLSSNTTLPLDATLKLGELTETVEVTASASVLQTESGAVQSEITGQQIRDQQLNGRNPLYMGSLLPGLRSGATLGDFNFAVGGSVPFSSTELAYRIRWSRLTAPRRFVPAAAGKSSVSPAWKPCRRCRCSRPAIRQNTGAQPAVRFGW